MPQLTGALKKLLDQTHLVVFPEDYVVAHLPTGMRGIPSEWFSPATTRFAVVIQEPRVVTLIVPQRKWLRMKSMFEQYDASGPMKVISFDIKLSLVSSGYLAAIGSLLTQASIRSIPISSFRNDHIIVQKADLPRAVRLLRAFLHGEKGRPSRKTAARKAGRKK